MKRRTDAKPARFVNIAGKSTNNRRKSTTNRRKIGLGPFLASEFDLPTLRNAPGAAPRRPKVRRGALLRSPGPLRGRSGSVWGRLGRLPGRTRDASEHCLGVFIASSSVPTARATIFIRFGAVARDLRCAFRISSCNSFQCFQQFGRNGRRATRRCKKRRQTCPRERPRAHPGEQNRGRAGQVERKNAPRPSESANE